MITVFTEEHAAHAGRFELAAGRLRPCMERPERAESVLRAVRGAGLEVVPPRAFADDAVLRRVHDPDYLAFLEGAHARWVAAHGAGDALPMCWPGGPARAVPGESIDAALGRFARAADSPITAGTWRAARAAADVARTGAALVLEGRARVFAATRPCGHHAGVACYGGYCYLNHAAIAAQSLLEGGAGRVAVLDVDYHHGNGTQEVFYERDDVLVVSIHADPRTDFPYYAGHADETGTGRGLGKNRNLPLERGADWRAYEPALLHALERVAAHRPDASVVSLGLDTFVEDPLGSFRLEREDFSRLGGLLAELGPVVVVLEGGYAVAELGPNVVAVLDGMRRTAGGESGPLLA